MRGRRAAQDQVAEVARRRLELLSAELGRASAGPEGAGEREPSSAAPTSGGSSAPTPDLSALPRVASAATTGPAAGRHARRPIGPTRRLGGWVHDHLPPTLQGRVALTPSHLTVVALLVAAGLAVTCWWVLGAQPQNATIVSTAATPRPVDVVPSVPSAPSSTTATGGAAVSGGTPSSAPAGSGTAASTGAAVTSPQIVVDVAGKVRRPGIATLPPGSRVVDAVDAAGGPRRGVDLTDLNLARPLVDGEQILVGVEPPPGVAAGAASAPAVGPLTGAASGTPALVNLNTATQADLEELPGIGPVTAQAILTWRTEHGAFSAVEELLEVSGIGEATLAEMAPFVTI